MGRFLAVALAAVMLLSPIHLFVLPQLRDYSKAPFFLVAIFILGYLVRYRLERRALWGLCAVLGVVIGASLGFRRDMIVCVPASLVVILFLLPGSLRKEYRKRIVAVAIVILCTVLCGWPILGTAGRKGSASSHVMLLGLSVPYNNNLGIGNDLYDFGYMANLDEAAHATVSSYAIRVLGHEAPVRQPSPEYEWACSKYYMDIAKSFPADMLLRWYASVLHILNYAPFNLQGEGSAYIHSNAFLERLLIWRLKTFPFLHGTGAYLAVLALALLACRSLRYAAAALFLLMFFAGYTSLQFNIRHFFHLEFIPWCVAGFLVQQSASGIWRLRLSSNRRDLCILLRQPRRWWAPPLWRLIGVLGIGGILLLLPLKVLQVYQDRKVGDLLVRCANLDLSPMEIDAEPLEGWPGWVVAKPRGFMAPESWPKQELASNVHTGYLVAEFAGDQQRIKARFLFDCENKLADVSRTMEIKLPNVASVTRVLFPVFSYSAGTEENPRRFSGVVIPQEDVPRLKGLYRVNNLEGLPLLLTITFAPGWKNACRHMTFKQALLPFHARAALASAENLMPPGLFESWSADGVPDGFTAPTLLSTISREAETVAEGKCAARQTWTGNDKDGSFFGQFHTEFAGLEPLTDYELFFKARNPSPENILGVYIWQVVRGPDGVTKLINLHGGHHTPILPSPGRFIEYSARFATQPAEDSSVLIFTSCTSDTKRFPCSVIWDDWRLLKLEP
jgi:hypothetical protein